MLASGGMAGSVGLWSVVPPALLIPLLKGHLSRVSVVLLSADGRILMSAGEDATIRWWSVATGQEMLLFPDARLPTHHADLFRGHISLEAEWNPGGRVLLWQERPGLLRVKPLPTPAESNTREH